MKTADLERFTVTLKTLAKVYGKTLDAEQITVYWQALNDRSFEDVEQRIEKYSKRGKFFPKPRDLRPIDVEDDKPEVNTAAEARFKAATDRSIRHWDLELADRPVMGKLRLCAAYHARLEIRDPSEYGLAERFEWLKAHVTELLRAPEAKFAWNDLDVRRLVLALYGAPGVHRLEELAA